jgi:hypothetical protein
MPQQHDSLGRSTRYRYPSGASTKSTMPLLTAVVAAEMAMTLEKSGWPFGRLSW